MTRASLDQGAAVLVLSRRGRRWAPLAEGPPIGRRFRWRHTIGAADLDRDRIVEIVSLRTPHLEGVVEAWRRRDAVLERIAVHPGVSAHAIHSRNLEQAALADLDGNGRPEVIVPVQGRDQLVALELRGSAFEERWRYALRGAIRSNLVVADLDGDGRLDLAVADSASLHVALSRAR